VFVVRNTRQNSLLAALEVEEALPALLALIPINNIIYLLALARTLHQQVASPRLLRSIGMQP
jgi:hypothetical protein